MRTRIHLYQHHQFRMTATHLRWGYGKRRQMPEDGTAVLAHARFSKPFSIPRQRPQGRSLSCFPTERMDREGLQYVAGETATGRLLVPSQWAKFFRRESVLVQNAPKIKVTLSQPRSATTLEF